MKLGWLCLDGTNSWETVSTLGTSIDIRLAVFDEILALGSSIHWFGLRKNSHLIRLKEHPRVVPDELLKQLVNDEIRRQNEQWRAISGKKKAMKLRNPNGYPMSKWVGSRAVTAVLRTLERHPLPEVDAFVAEYMDNGINQIVYFAAAIIHYSSRSIPVYVRDPERRFRYISEFSILHETPRSNMYEHRLERYLAPEHVDVIRGKIRMIYPFHADWDKGTDGFYRGKPIEMSVAYDASREIDIVPLKERIPVVMVGNDNNRRAFIEEWYGPLKHRANIYGNWKKRDANYVKSWKKINKKVRFFPPVPQDRAIETLGRGASSIFHIPQMSIRLGQVTYRVCEVPMAGSINITPHGIQRAEEWTLPDFIVNNPKEVNQKIQELVALSDREFRGLVEAQRELVRQTFEASYVAWDLIEALREDGVEVFNGK